MASLNRGVSAMKQRLMSVADNLSSDLLSALKEEANVIVQTAKSNHVPVDWGTLRDSIRSTDPVREGDELSISIFAGGPDIPYAVAVHEHPSESSPPSWRGTTVTFHPPGRGPKYLERPLLDAAPTLAQRIARRIRLRTKG
jgi:hypothetical protein